MDDIEPLVCPNCGASKATIRDDDRGFGGPKITETWFCETCNLSYRVIYHAVEKRETAADTELPDDQ